MWGAVVSGLRAETIGRRVFLAVLWSGYGFGCFLALLGLVGVAVMLLGIYLVLYALYRTISPSWDHSLALLTAEKEDTP